jgi:hypothetical protein
LNNLKLDLDMRFPHITPFLIATPILFSGANTWGCPAPGQLPRETDLQYPPVDMIAFKGIITKTITYGNLNEGLPHGGFQLTLKITKVYQGNKLGDTIAINYGGCHLLPGKQGSEINVLARFNQKEGWSAPQFWKSSNKPITKREWYQCW